MNVTVIGAGAMGRQIAMNTALNGRKEGYQVVLTDSFEKAVESAKTWAADYLKGRVDKGRITQEEAEAFEKLMAAGYNIEFALIKEAAIGNWKKFRGQFGFN